MLDLGLISRDVEIGSIYQREWYPINLGD